MRVSRLLQLSIFTVCAWSCCAGTGFAAGRHEGNPTGGDSNPMVAPPGSSPYGKSYGEWSAEHWKWLFSIPNAVNPANDFTGVNAGQNQSGSVWFLAGSFCPEPPLSCSNFVVTRNITVPNGVALFFPILDSECSTVEGNGTTDAELRACAQGFQDVGTGMTCSIDGVPVDNLQDYRVQSPLYTFGPLPEGNFLEVFGVDAPAGTTSPSVSDGVFLMVHPLGAGVHTIHFTGAEVPFGFGMDITYHINVGGKSAPQAALTAPVPVTWGHIHTIYR